MRISVAEDFYSIQGEGPTMGYPAIFIRLAGCNLMCGGQGTQHDKELHNGATWRCDTIEVWMKGKSHEVGNYVNQLVKKYGIEERAVQARRIIITGGEPLMQSKGVFELISILTRGYGFHSSQIEIETNGTIYDEAITSLGVQFNISPKLSNSGETSKNRYVENTLRKLCTVSNYFFKFVVGDDKDLYEVLTFYNFVPRNKIYLMPPASDKETLMVKSKWLAGKCLSHELKFSSRLQVAIWNETTGV